MTDELIVSFEPHSLNVSIDNQLLNASSKETIIRGADGKDGQDGQPGAPGAPGEDGVSPTVEITTVTGGHAVTITDADHPSGQTFNVLDGQDGQDGQPGQQGPAGQDGAPGADGVSPTVEITSVTGGHSVTITDKDHPGGQSFNVMDGTIGHDGAAGPPGIAVQDTAPTTDVQMWLDTDGDPVIVPEIDDNSTNLVDTWSSQKISNSIGLVDNSLTGTQRGLAIIVDGDLCDVAVPVGGYAYIRNNTHGLAEGLYTNTSASAFPTTGGTADSTVFTAVSGGGLNELRNYAKTLSLARITPQNRTDIKSNLANDAWYVFPKAGFFMVSSKTSGAVLVQLEDTYLSFQVATNSSHVMFVAKGMNTRITSAYYSNVNYAFFIPFDD